MSKSEKIEIYNHSNKPLTIMPEPLGEVYTLREKERVEIKAEDCGEDFQYSIAIGNNGISVYPEGEGGNYLKMYSNGVELDCGYNRELIEDKRF